MSPIQRPMYHDRHMEWAVGGPGGELPPGLLVWRGGQFTPYRKFLDSKMQNMLFSWFLPMWQHWFQLYSQTSQISRPPKFQKILTARKLEVSKLKNSPYLEKKIIIKNRRVGKEKKSRKKNNKKLKFQEFKKITKYKKIKKGKNIPTRKKK